MAGFYCAALQNKGCDRIIYVEDRMHFFAVSCFVAKLSCYFFYYMAATKINSSHILTHLVLRFGFATVALTLSNLLRWNIQRISAMDPKMEDGFYGR